MKPHLTTYTLLAVVRSFAHVASVVEYVIVCVMLHGLTTASREKPIIMLRRSIKGIVSVKVSGNYPQPQNPPIRRSSPRAGQFEHVEQ